MSPDAELWRDPTRDVGCHRPDDRFIPVRVSNLVAALAVEPELGGGAANWLPDVAAALEDVTEQEGTACERELLEAYVPFNPDRDTLPPDGDQGAGAEEAALRGLIEYLLAKANFRRLDEAAVAAALRQAHRRGLRVRLHPERVRYLSLWARGEGRAEQHGRTWRHPIAGETHAWSVYRRLVVVSALRDDPNLLLKMFKDIPAQDVESLLPHAEVRMTLFDRLKVFGGGAGMVGSAASKTMKLLAGLAYWSRIGWVLLIGGAVLLYRTIRGYRSAWTQRDWQRTRHLYYQNLANNAGVLHVLVAMIAQEEVKEALLAYAFCASARPSPASPEDLDRRIESFLRRRFAIEVNFDGEDAVQTLHRLGLWNDAGRLAVLPPAVALAALQTHRRDAKTRDHHRNAWKLEAAGREDRCPPRAEGV